MNAFQWSCLICFLIGSSAGDPSPVEVSAVLGEEVTFPVRVTDGFEIEEIICVFKGSVIAKMSPGKNYTVRDARFAGRLRAADESGSIKIRQLRIEDSGLYRIEIYNKKKPTEKETKLYELEIFRSSASGPSTVEVSAVLGEEVTFPVWVRDGFEIEEITCIFKGSTIATMSPGKNYTVRDGRFAGRLCAADGSGSIKIRSLRTEDRGVYIIEIFNKRDPTAMERNSYELEIFKSASNQSVCCTVKNPASNASDCVHPRGHCFPDSGAAVACTGCACGYPVRITACAAATAICALVGFIVYRLEQCKEQDQRGKQNSQ